MHMHSDRRAPAEYTITHVTQSAMNGAVMSGPGFPPSGSATFTAAFTAPVATGADAAAAVLLCARGRREGVLNLYQYF